MSPNHSLEDALETLTAMIGCAESAGGYFRECGQRWRHEEYFFTILAAEMGRQASRLRYQRHLIFCRPWTFSAGTAPGAAMVEATTDWIDRAGGLIRSGNLTHADALATAREIAGAVLQHLSSAIVVATDEEYEDLREEMVRTTREHYHAISRLMQTTIAEPGFPACG